MTRPSTTAARCTGSSLMEVLIAVSVLSIGLLGTASLQITSKRANLEARERATATALSQDILERMRTNPGELAVYTNDGAGRTLTGNSMSAVDCSGGCTGAQMALHDLYELEQAVTGVSEQVSGTRVGGLSAPRVCITGPNGASGVYTLAIAWRGLTPLNDPAGASTCGQGSGDYDSNDGSQADVHRRVLAIQTFFGEPL